MTEERVMDNVSGSIWGSHPPRKERDMISDRSSKRKPVFLKKILGELEAYVESPMEEWEEHEEASVWDILDAIHNTVKAQMSSNDEGYKG